MEISFIPTMDCEPPKSDVSGYAHEKSGSGPDDYAQSERSIRGYVEVLNEAGYTPTLFVHPQVAKHHRELLLDLQDTGVCLGLHLHPYKLDETYRQDLGFYTHKEQQALLTQAIERWENALDQRPRYFRPGVFSANDSTFSILEQLGFRGGSVSSPGRVLPNAAAIWAGCMLDPHRAHRGFRAVRGDSEFVEVPMTVDPSKPVESGHARHRGFQSLYLAAFEKEGINPEASAYNLGGVLKNVVGRLRREAPKAPVVMTNTHNNMRYLDPNHPATVNLQTVLEALDQLTAAESVTFGKGTIETVVNSVLSQ